MKILQNINHYWESSSPFLIKGFNKEFYISLIELFSQVPNLFKIIKIKILTKFIYAKLY